MYTIYFPLISADSCCLVLSIKAYQYFCYDGGPNKVDGSG